MKKILTIFLCLAMCLAFCGCNNTEKKNNEAKAVFTKVLNKEESFTVVEFLFLAARLKSPIRRI